MALIESHTQFNPDESEARVFGIAFDAVKRNSGEHQHRKAQLLFAGRGCMRITIGQDHTVLPPGYAAWIPEQTRHSAVMNNIVQYRSLYFEPGALPEPLGAARVIRLNPLLHALAERMAYWNWDMPVDKQLATLTLFWEELTSVEETTLTLRLPHDKRLARWLIEIQENTRAPEPLNQLVNQVGASEKTISRIFSRDTGLPYQAWRQRWRALKALELLVEGRSLSDTAQSLGFCSDSAFIALFKQQLGTTPGRYLAQATPPSK